MVSSVCATEPGIVSTNTNPYITIVCGLGMACCGELKFLLDTLKLKYKKQDILLPREKACLNIVS